MASFTHIALEPPPSRFIAAHAPSSSMNCASSGSVGPGTVGRRPSATTKYMVLPFFERPTAVRGCGARVKKSLPGSVVIGSHPLFNIGQPDTPHDIHHR